MTSSKDFLFADMIRSTSGFLTTAVGQAEAASGINPIQNTHFTHLKTLFSKSTCTMQDGKDAIELLDASRCFSAEQKVTLRTTISCQTTLAGPVAANASVKSQSCLYFNHFLPEYLWSCIMGEMSTKEKYSRSRSSASMSLAYITPRRRPKRKSCRPCSLHAIHPPLRRIARIVSKCLASVSTAFAKSTRINVSPSQSTAATQQGSSMIGLTAMLQIICLCQAR